MYIDLYLKYNPYGYDRPFSGRLRKLHRPYITRFVLAVTDLVMVGGKFLTLRCRI